VGQRPRHRRRHGRALGVDQPLGPGFTAGIVELGGGFTQADLTAYFGGLGLPVPNVTAVPVAGGSNTPDGPDGADGEVLLDIEVLGAVAPGATIRVYFAPNTDAGFLAAIKQAIADGCDVLSISWGQAESSGPRPPSRRSTPRSSPPGRPAASSSPPRATPARATPPVPT
jgi:subtilase family serine protease